MSRRESHKNPPSFRPESALLVGPAVGFGRAHQIDPQSSSAQNLLADIRIETADAEPRSSEAGPQIFSRPSVTARFSPRATLKPVPEEEHRTLSVEEVERLSPAPLRDGVTRSAFIHSAIFLLVLLKSVFLPGEPTPISPTLRVDLVGLPDYLKSEMKGMIAPPPDLVDALQQAEQAAKQQVEEEKQARLEQEEEKKVEKKVAPPKNEPDGGEQTVAIKKEKPATKKEKTEDRDEQLKKALARVKALNRLESIKNAERSKESKMKTAGIENREGTLIRGNRLSQGTSLDGDAREAAQSSYYELVRDKLVAHWALPVWLARQNHQAQVVIYIDVRGRLRDFRFTRPSGSETFDAAVKRALQESQPFVPPPTELAAEVQNRGILVGFPL